MVMPQYSNLEIDFWIHDGKLGLSAPTLCLFHDSPQHGTAILDALNELLNGSCPAQRTLTFANCERASALSNMRLLYVPEREELLVMNIRHRRPSATIEATAEGLKLLITAFTEWHVGGEDFGVCPRRSDFKQKQLGQLDRSSIELWFWGPRYAGP